MKLTILGPWGAYPKAGEATAGYLLEHGKHKILIDCGSGVLAQLQRYTKLSDLTAVIVSHTHYDHAADLGCLQYAALIDTDLGLRSTILPVYIAKEANHTYKDMIGSEIISIHTDEVLHIYDFQFTFFTTFHGAYCLGMRISMQDQIIVYTADTYYDDSLVDYCAAADILIAETSFYKANTDAQKYGHMNSKDVGTLASKANVGKLILTHLPHFGDLKQLALEAGEVYKGPIELAFCGMELTW